MIKKFILLTCMILMTITMLMGCNNPIKKENPSTETSTVDINNTDTTGPIISDPTQESKIDDNANKKSEWVRYFSIGHADFLINLSSYEHSEGKYIKTEDFAKKFISKEVIDGLGNFYKIGDNFDITSDGQYLVFSYSINNSIYKSLEILPDREKNSFELGHYNVCYSLKERKMIPFNNIKDMTALRSISAKFAMYSPYYNPNTGEYINLDLGEDLSVYYVCADSDKAVLGKRAGENKIKFVFYDIGKRQKIDEYVFDNGEPFCITGVTQWHTDGYILFMANHKSYKYDINKKELTKLGDFLWPYISEDNNLLFYVRQKICPSSDHEIEGVDDPGIFVKNLTTGDVRKVIEGFDFTNEDFEPPTSIKTDIDYLKN